VQIEIAREVLCELLDRDIIASPKRNSVELHPQAGSGQCRHEKLLVAKAFAGADSKCVLAGETIRMPFDGRLRATLRRNQEPLVGFGEPGDNSAIGRLHLGFRLLQLLRVEVQSFLFQGDGVQARYRRTASSRSCNRVWSTPMKVSVFLNSRGAAPRDSRMAVAAAWALFVGSLL